MYDIGTGRSRDRDPGAQVHYHHSGDPQVMDESLSGLVLLPPMMYGTWQCSVRAIQLKHLKLDLDSTYAVSRLPCLRHSVHLLVVVSVTERVGGNS